MAILKRPFKHTVDMTVIFLEACFTNTDNRSNNVPSKMPWPMNTPHGKQIDGCCLSFGLGYCDKDLGPSLSYKSLQLHAGCRGGSKNCCSSIMT